jgi:hypothetical protein
VAAYSSGLRIVNVSDPSNPVEIGFCSTPNIALGVAVSGSYAYVAAHSAGLRVIDVSDPSNPVEVGHCDTPGNALNVVVSGTYAYVANSVQGVRVVSISDPSNPTEVGYIDTPGNVYDVAVFGSYAYVADFFYGMRVVDVTNPANPVEVGFAGSGFTEIRGVEVSGSYAYIAGGLAGLHIMDVTTPSNPVEVGYYNTAGISYDMVVSGCYAYLADYFYFSIYDCSGAASVNPLPPSAEVPTSFTLNAPFPNPFNPTTTISFTLPYLSRVKLEVFDITGRIVWRYSGAPLQMTSGTHTLTFNGADLPSGIYLARLTSGKWSQTQKMVLVK